MALALAGVVVVEGIWLVLTNERKLQLTQFEN